MGVMGMTPTVRRALKILVSSGLLYFLFTRISWPAVLERVEHLDRWLAALVIFLFALQLAVSSWKWQWALRIHALSLPYGFLTRILVIGFFLNHFLPTSIGGDAFRIYRTLPESPPRSRAVSAVLLERLVGFAALILLGLIGAIVLYTLSPLARAYVAFSLAGALVVLGMAALLRFDLWQPRSRWLLPIRDNLLLIRRARAEWPPLIGISLLFQLQAILIVYVLFYAIGSAVSPAQAALITAAAGLAGILPFAINGLGVVEATIAGTAVAVGADYESGLLVALLMRILLVPLTLLAGLVYAFEPARTQASALEGSPLEQPCAPISTNRK